MGWRQRARSLHQATSAVIAAAPNPAKATSRRSDCRIFGIAKAMDSSSSSTVAGASIGTPDQCIRHFERLWQGSDGGFGGVLLLAHNWADWTATRKSYELMARYVHPHFQAAANELRDWSYLDAKAKFATAGAQSKAAVQAAIDTYQRSREEGPRRSAR